MLVVNPFVQQNAVHHREPPPRIISSIRKPNGTLDSRPKLSGELLVKVGVEKKWWPRRSIVRNGHLYIYPASHLDAESAGTLRLALRQLSLRAGPLPNSLSLCKGPIVVVTLQTTNEHSFGTWVKTLAIELIRQTPLDAVKHLDIFQFLHGWRQGAEIEASVDQNSNYIESAKDEDGVDGGCVVGEGVKQTVETLLKKCQNAESYVPVKEKLVLFESLCKLGRKVRSTEDVSRGAAVVGQKRARSLHDLTNSRAVREMCKFFDSIEQNGTIARFDGQNKSPKISRF